MGTLFIVGFVYKIWVGLIKQQVNRFRFVGIGSDPVTICYVDISFLWASNSLFQKNDKLGLGNGKGKESNCLDCSMKERKMGNARHIFVFLVWEIR